jgi:hypothetical protein
MHTLIDYMTRTKGIEYLLAIILIVSFYVVWQLLHCKEKLANLAARLAPAILIILIIGIVGFFKVRSSPPETPPAPPDAGTQLPGVELLANMYKPAWLNHDLHKQRVGDCKTCHHYSGNSIIPCRKCHDASSNPKDLTKPGLAHIYHLRCIGCHKENKIGPTECKGCHTSASVPPLRSSHPLTQIQNCLSCHGPDGIAGVKRIPPDHSRISGSVCQLCHMPPLDSALRAVHRIPHGKDRPGCLVCHGEGMRGIAKVPANHAGRTDETCLLCHRVQGE